MRKTYHAYILIAPLMAGCVLFYIVPFALILRHSFLRGSGRSAQFVGLENYMEVIGSEAFARAFGNSMLFLAVGVPLIMLVSYLIALLLQHQVDRHKLLKSVFLFPYIMPVAGTVLLINLLFSESGLANEVLAALGLPVQSWLRGPQAFWILIGMYLWKSTGYSVILLLAGLVTIPGEQYESADLDGASGIQKFRYITTPQMWYSVFFAAIFSVINAFKCFREIFLIGGEHPVVRSTCRNILSTAS
ncbi:carbohydrate ABC transporter permease [Ruthenibacterium lactatiformans]|uniref:carbohydrate ABC transporter permease n=1 Tax=Ruthenibacterium lactatiformans TaxID=1550024 RepID=UPI003996041D